MIACPAWMIREGDLIQFPDGNGGTVLAPVLRVMLHRGNAGNVEVLFGDEGASEYKVLREGTPCLRAPREGE